MLGILITYHWCINAYRHIYHAVWQQHVKNKNLGFASYEVPTYAALRWDIFELQCSNVQQY